ncbi:26491_t:CDS:2, partial [Dentiscutata erythropus]
NTPQSEENKDTDKTLNMKANNKTCLNETTDVNKQAETNHVFPRDKALTSDETGLAQILNPPQGILQTNNSTKKSLAAPSTDEPNSQINLSPYNSYNANIIVDSLEPSTSNKVEETNTADQKSKPQEMTPNKTSLINEANSSKMHSERSTENDNTNLILITSPVYKTLKANTLKGAEEEFILVTSKKKNAKNKGKRKTTLDNNTSDVIDAGNSYVPNL